MSNSDNIIMKRLQQENRILKMENETLKLRIKSLVEEKKSLQEASVSIQARAEQEEEYISNTLLKKIQVSLMVYLVATCLPRFTLSQTLKKEKETLALNYEQEEECLTNDLSRKLNKLREEKVQLEKTLESEHIRSGNRSRSSSVNEWPEESSVDLFHYILYFAALISLINQCIRITFAYPSRCDFF